MTEGSKHTTLLISAVEPPEEPDPPNSKGADPNRRHHFYFGICFTNQHVFNVRSIAPAE